MAGFVYAEVDDFLGRRLVSLPFSDFCDPLIDQPAQWETIAGDLLSRPEPFSVKPLLDRHAESDGRLHEVGRVKWHRCDVTRDPETMWAGLHPGARRAIRKAEGGGVTIRAAENLADVRAFFDLHLKTRKHKYQLLAQPWRFFESIWHRFLEPGDGELLLAEADGAVLGGVMFLHWKQTSYYKFNASETAALELRPNDLTLWEGLRRANATDLAWVDFGVSDLDQEGLIRYKRKYATEEGEVRFLKRRVDPDPREVGARAILTDVTSLFVEPGVPDEVTERAGDVLYRFFT